MTERFAPRYVMAAIAVIVGGSSALFIIANSTAEILAYSTLFGFGVGGLLSVPPVAYANYYGRRSLGAIRGVTEPLTSFGQAIGAVLSGAVFDLTESYELAFLTFAILSGLAMLLGALGPAAAPTGANSGLRTPNLPDLCLYAALLA